MYHNAAELLEQAAEREVPMWQIVLENEIRISGRSEQQIFAELAARYLVMQQSAAKALTAPQPTVGGLIEGQAQLAANYAAQAGICGSLVTQAMASALSCSEVNASMGQICAAPTAGACGILPAVLISMQRKLACAERDILQALLLSSGLGAIITKNATVSGAEGGCQAECGVAAAMAAAAAVQLAGGTGEQCLAAASFALINCMGLVCDPVAGLVQLPCALRNASQTVNALLCADLALAGIPARIPFDQTVDAMYRVGKMMAYPLRETALGGIAATPAAKEIAKNIFQKSK